MKTQLLSQATPGTRRCRFLGVVSVALVSLTAAGEAADTPCLSTLPEIILEDCFRPTEDGRWRRLDEACVEAHPALPPGAAGPGKDISRWDLPNISYACGAYEARDPELEDCEPTAGPLPPELEWYELFDKPFVRPPEGVIVLHPDGTWSEAPACLPELVEEQRFNNWRFCRESRRFDRIPKMWNPPISGIPYAEAEDILEVHRAALEVLPEVTNVSLHLQSILVETWQPEIVPDVVEGIPVQTLPPLCMIPYRPVWVEPR